MTTEKTAPALNSTQWASVAAVATAASCLGILASLVLIYRQVKHTRTSAVAAAFSKALEILQDEARRIDRRTVFALEAVPLEKWTEDQRLAAERVIHSYDQVATMVQAHMFPKDLVVDNWGHSLRNSKPVLMPLVRQYREKWKSSEVWDGFEWLCDEAERANRKQAQRTS